MDASNGPPVDSRLIAAPTVAPPPGVRPLAQQIFSQPLGPQLGLQGLASGFRPTQFNPAAGSGMPMFQAQPTPLPSQSLGTRKASLERSKAAAVSGAARKQCNCKNSRCLKLYCECFASGRYCENCNCVQCFNNREHEATRQSAVEAILERNPNAFRPKIQSAPQSNDPAPVAAAAVVANASVPGRHLKGCNCKKSSCLKKYCECFQAGIFCSDNCKCVDCKNFEDAHAAVGIPIGVGAKRLRYGSAPPPAVQGSFGLAAAAMHGVALGAIRPGLLQAGGFGALVQQQQAAGMGGLQMGLAGAVAAAAAAAGAAATGGAGGSSSMRASAPQGVVGNLAGLSPGGMASLPQALSLALAAASGSAPQLLSLQSAASGGPQLGAPMVVAPGPPTLPATATATTAAPPSLPLRVKMQEVVNGMVKRSVIEELCRLLWMVADDEAASARVTTLFNAGVGGSGGLSSVAPQLDSMPAAGHSSAAVEIGNGIAGGASYSPRSGLAETPTAEELREGLQTQGDGDAVAATTPSGANDGANGMICEVTSGCGGAEASVAGIVIKSEPGIMDIVPVASGSHSYSQSGGGQGGAALRPLVVTEGTSGEGAGVQGVTSNAPAAATTEEAVANRRGRGGAGQRRLESPKLQQQQPRRPGPLYGRKERVVLEEFLSIMNKISDTAAKKLQQHSTTNSQAVMPPPVVHQQQPVAQQPSYGYHPQVLHAQQQQQQQPGGMVSTAAGAAGTGAGGPPSGAFSSIGRQPAHATSLIMAAAPPPPPPGFSNGQVGYPVGMNGPVSGTANAAPFPQQPVPYGSTGGVDAGADTVVIVAPTVTPSASATGPAVSAGEQQTQTLTHQLPPLHGGVPVILAPPRGSHSSSIPTPPPLPQQPHLYPPQQQPLRGLSECQNQPPAADAPFPIPFLPFSMGMPAQPDAVREDQQQQQRQPDNSSQQQNPEHQHSDTMLEGIMTASEQQLVIWSPHSADHETDVASGGGTAAGTEATMMAAGAKASVRSIPDDTRGEGIGGTDLMDTTGT